MSTFTAGAAQVDVTPTKSLFLFGYPNVPRFSDGVYDPLLASALYVSNSQSGVLFIGVDIIWVPRDLGDRASARIAQQTGIKADHIMITATHTHSGPMPNAMLANAADSIVPPADKDYQKQLEEALVAAGVAAIKSARPAVLSGAIADGSKLGTNRRNPAGASIPTMPVLVAAEPNGKLIGVMVVCSMHPTVLHEDWLKYSGDFPGLGRRKLQNDVIGRDVPFVYHMGSSGNQSPRHVVKGNTIAEAERIGGILADAVASAIKTAKPLTKPDVYSKRADVTLPLRQFPPVEQAEKKLNDTLARFARLKRENAPRTEIRTCECDVFGAEETLTLARSAVDGRAQAIVDAYNPFVVQVIGIGEWKFVGWPGEVFVEFALDVMKQSPDTFIITLANGDVQGYIVTAEAVEEGGYEASNAVFASPESGDRIVRTTLELLK